VPSVWQDDHQPSAIGPQSRQLAAYDYAPWPFLGFVRITVTTASATKAVAT
jgi:hypothetical protein